MVEIGSMASDERARPRRLAVGIGVVLAVSLLALTSLALGPGPSSSEPAAAPPQELPEAGGPAAAPAPRAPRHVGEGSASYYSDLLEGRPTASGQPYRGADLTAAHPSLPFGSRLRVTNLANGRSVVVRVNDRGPFSRRHVLDVSRTAAGRLGILSQGHAQVRMELLQ